MGFSSFFTSVKDEACEATTSRIFDGKVPMMERQMQRAGDDAPTIAAAVAQRREEYISNVCNKPAKPPKP
jgi:hypothetical protein